MAANLAPIFVNNERVTLQGEPRPAVAKIVAASGKSAEKVQVVRLKRQTDSNGRPMQLDDVIDRTQQADSPVYLKFLEPEGAVGTTPEWKDPASTVSATEPNEGKSPFGSSAQADQGAAGYGKTTKSSR
ncbi:MAG: hypothetical protein WC876_11140 [Candidatus Thermoplasmatota archaeon]|jgi:hypothetical protein